MNDISILVGGAVGEGVNEAGAMIGRLFNRLGYHVYMYCDYPSLIRGGHNYAITRACDRPIGACPDKVDAVLALNQDAIDRHRHRWKDGTIIIYDPARAQAPGGAQPSLALPLADILQESGSPPPMRATGLIGALGRVLGIPWSVLEEALRKHAPAPAEQHLQVARRGYEAARQQTAVERLDRPALPLMSGNQAISLGLLKAGLQAYVAYPMTPTSPILEFLAASAQEFGLQVIPPESEIAVMIMALGYAYMGVRTAVGTSGGGFSLMVEGLGLAGQAELPVVVVMGQRTGPSTGMPTYSAQTDLHFVLHAGQGEFPRLIVAPGDAEEAYYCAGSALNLAWKYQLPAFVLTDRVLNLGLYSFDAGAAGDLREEPPVLWNGAGDYRRYQYTETGVSPLAFPPLPGQAVKVNSYTHDEHGITTEEPRIATEIVDKWLLKERSLAKELEGYPTVRAYGQGRTALLCWGSNKGVCLETAQRLGLKVIQPLVLSPFPAQALARAMIGVERIISVECNATGQLATLLQQHGYHIDERILKYDGRPFSLEELEDEVKKVIA